MDIATNIIGVLSVSSDFISDRCLDVYNKNVVILIDVIVAFDHHILYYSFAFQFLTQCIGIGMNRYLNESTNIK